MSLYTSLLPVTLNISTLPNKKNLLTSNQVAIEDLKKLDLGDIIKRKIFDIKNSSIKDFKNKSILVTGGAGSIGSELSKQLLKSHPKKLLIVDNSEYSLFKIKEQLGLRKNIKYILLDINHQKHVEKIIKENQVQYIFHAAAYKHVNFLEENLISAVKNNILATLSLLKSIKNTNINLTIISTDKAVEPKNILGMTKRASEIITLTMSKANEYKQSKISVVRFGNVFGSAGSAVEIFKKQIINDLPVTLTDIKMQRFFMSIREACNLVLQASRLKYSSSIFVLKMGKPIKIIDIINKIFNLMQRKNQKLKINIIGKFKSEKINEKLSNNRLRNTTVKDINIINYKILNIKIIEKFLNDLEFSLNNLNEKKTFNLLKKFTQ
jgi:FlaA1/EpsC-like NDP-sugar epimerase